MDPVTSLHLLYISRNLVNCCATVGTSFTNYPEQIEVAEFEHYGRRTCSKHPRSIDCRRRRQQSRPSASFVDNTIDLSWRNLLSPEFMTKIQSEVSIFCRYQNFTTPCRTGGRQLPCQNQLDAFSRFDRTSTCDRYRQTDGQTRGNASWFKAKVKQTGSGHDRFRYNPTKAAGKYQLAQVQLDWTSSKNVLLDELTETRAVRGVTD